MKFETKCNIGDEVFFLNEKDEVKIAKIYKISLITDGSGKYIEYELCPTIPLIRDFTLTMKEEDIYKTFKELENRRFLNLFISGKYWVLINKIGEKTMNIVSILDEDHKLSIRRKELKITDSINEYDISNLDSHDIKKTYIVSYRPYLESFTNGFETWHKIIGNNGEILYTKNKIFFSLYGSAKYLEKSHGKIDEDFYIKFDHFKDSVSNFNIYKRELSRKLLEINKNSNKELYEVIEYEIELVDRIIKEKSGE